MATILWPHMCVSVRVSVFLWESESWFGKERRRKIGYEFNQNRWWYLMWGQEQREALCVLFFSNCKIHQQHMTEIFNCWNINTGNESLKRTLHTYALLKKSLNPQELTNYLIQSVKEAQINFLISVWNIKPTQTL